MSNIVTTQKHLTTMKAQDLTIVRLKASYWLTNAVSCGYKLRNRSIACSTSLALIWGWGWSVTTLAQSSLTPSTPEICQIDRASLAVTDRQTNPNIVTADTASPKGMTIPSLWWTSEQFPAKLVTNWVADRRQNQIYVIVNTQYWNILDYIDRYRTIAKFGRVAYSYGYSLKICNTQKIAIARYTCNSTAAPVAATNSTPTTAQNTCQIWLNSNDQNGLGVQTR
ncbi:hypothetical protein [Chamaesiphon polymorphus]|uniref:Uncharacterized protein n=1 Tax=Chamaesiphon polymorphus CCALA 037 TaxID=2107692 RepID=A0A2T1F9T9_9CYAN|nr:hypothetical protein [Chamaesiphon polymorphus]PSB41765.1 hypothetical protein C7B77_27175 [Chamaesiphon polymorphus CCALA 037]